MSSNEPVKSGCELIYEMFHIFTFIAQLVRALHFIYSYITSQEVNYEYL